MEVRSILLLTLELAQAEQVLDSYLSRAMARGSKRRDAAAWR